MPTSMIDRVARAMFPDYFDPEKTANERPDYITDRQHIARVKAMVAIAAMREPTEEMTKAGASVRTETPEYIAQADKDRAGGMWMSMIGEGGARLHYCAMIDAALKDPT